MKSKVAAYITCYEDEESANRCIKAIESQSIKIKQIYIVDNSNKPLVLNNNNRLLLIHHYPNNIGIGEGLNKALEWAIDLEYDFLWTFDQDSVPTSNCLEILLTTYHQLARQDSYEIGIIAPTASDPRTSQVVEGAVFLNDRFVGLTHNDLVDFYECDSPITSGSLISLAAAKSISPPSADLFIDGIDLDYGVRLIRKGFHNFIVIRATMEHYFGNPVRVEFKNKDSFKQQYSALRHYYICRNHTYLEIRFAMGSYRLHSFRYRIKYMLATIFWILKCDMENRKLKIWACLLGTFDGLIGNLGKNW